RARGPATTSPSGRPSPAAVSTTPARGSTSRTSSPTLRTGPRTGRAPRCSSRRAVLRSWCGCWATGGIGTWHPRREARGVAGHVRSDLELEHRGGVVPVLDEREAARLGHGDRAAVDDD